MRDEKDTDTLGLPGIKAPTVPKKRGRQRVHASAAAKQAAYIARNGLVSVSFQLPASVHADFERWLASKDKKKSAVLAHLIQTQLLRKR